MPPEPRPDLRELMLRLADGDRAALEPLYAALWPRVLSFTTHALPSAPDAEDVAQRSLLKLFAQASSFDHERDPLGWALTLAAFEVRTERQRKRRRKELTLEASDERAAPAASPEDQVIAVDLEGALTNTIASLRPEDAATLRAVLAGERPPVADATFRKRVERATARLRTAWRLRHGEDT